ncbi:WD40 repeat protein [Streptosporangium album]|uniref:WD40 repeat protein n=1 Tax=Streptosporangium album TaxID=47479 RepID=A0A7W7S3M6_9ACTN|nr:WD40 repeat domain-containing protein [Streptosporangium album]MBB4943314.1 WD40 repeat protein [Streptosporangium album]
MIISGSTIVLAGRFSRLSKDEAKRGLEALGAKVTASVSAKTDLVFAGAKSGVKAGPAAVRGVPIYDEDALVAVLAGREPGTAPPSPPFTGVPDERMGPDEALDTLKNADWSAFSPERDTVPLRDALQALERAHGVTGAHRLATARLRDAGTLLRHSDVHHGELNGHALSPDGRHLAVGSWTGDDYDRGGVLQVFEVATGRCVHAIDGIMGGIGFPDYTRSLQWSADGTRIALEYNTNATGVWDPFGTAHEPIANAFFLASGRPLGMALAPEGRRAFVYGGESDYLRNVIVAMHEGSVAGPPDSNPEGTEPIEFSGPLPDESRETWSDEPELILGRAFWSRDGSRVYGEAEGEYAAISLDVQKRQVSWILGLEKSRDSAPPEWSLDERLLAYQRDGKLIISDALTGETTAELPGYPGADVLCWGPGGRLAVVDPAGGTVGIVDATTGEHRHDLNIQADTSNPRGADARSWAWSPDGERAACVTAEGRIEIWSERPGQLRVLDGIRRTINGWDHGFGLEWPADDVLIAIGPHAVRFLRPETGEIIADHPFHHAPAARRPLFLTGRDLGDQLRLNPTFALDEDTWAVAFEDGTVIAQPGRDDDLAELDGRLCWSIARRFAWPFRWGDQKIFPDPAHAGVGAASPETERLLAPFRGRGSTAEATGTWPPPDTATVTDLITAVRGTLVDLTVQDSFVHGEWTVNTLQQLAMICARRGEAAEARELALAMPEHRRRLGHLARIALALGAAGFDAEAAAVLPYADNDLADVSDAADMAAVAGACAVLGWHERSERWFASAREAADAHRSNWEVRLPLVWALTECGREQEARVVLDEGVGTPGNRHHGVPWLVYLLRRGETELVRELIGERSEPEDPDKPHAYGVRWFDDWTAARALTAYGQPDLLRLWGDINRAWVQDDLPVAERITAEGRPTGPTDDQLTDLAAQHAGIAKLPKATKRRESAQVARNAAECGHVSAVLDLLPGTGDPDKYGGLNSDTRTWVALSALRTIAIGVDVDVW